MNFSAKLIILLMILIPLLVGVNLFGYQKADEQTRPRLTIHNDVRDKFAHVIVCLDPTRSISDAKFRDAKEIVKRRIIDMAGIGDRVVCYRIGPRFGTESYVFGKLFEDQPSQLLQEQAQTLLDIIRKSRAGNLKPDDTGAIRSSLDLIAKFQPGVEGIHKVWKEQVDELQRPTALGSDYLGALAGIKAEYEDNPTNRTEEKWLFIVGDLINDTSRVANVQRLVDPRAENRQQRRNNTGRVATVQPVVADKQAFADVHIVLIYPFDSAVDETKIKTFWKNYFGENTFKFFSFAAVLREEFVLKPNPTTGLVNAQVGTFGESFRKYLFIDLGILFVFLMIAVVVFMFSRHPKKQSLTT